MAKPKKRKSGGSPELTRENVLAFLSKHPDKNTKRDLARAFGIRGNDKIELKAILRELLAEGLMEKRGKRLREPGTLPPVAVLDIVTRDRDGGLLAKPAEWDETANGKPPTIEIARATRGGKATAGVGNRILARLQEKHGKSNRYTGKIIKVLANRTRDILGIVRRTESGVRLVPTIRNQDEMELFGDDLAAAKDGDLVTAEISKSGKYGLKRAKITGIVGSIDSEKALSLIAIHAHDIPHVFPDAVLNEANALSDTKLEPREDWRHLPIITIDPADAKDHDDAVYAEADPDQSGGFLLYVAIADVSIYVQPGTALDREALKRGNSVYFPDRVVPMLPENISNNMCSLREKEDRPALGVKMVISPDGKKRRHSFHRVWIRSAAKLSYQQAQAAFDGKPDGKTAEFVEPVLKPLHDAWRALMKSRNERQPLELDLPERKIMLKADGTVDRVITPDRLDAHRLIEEFMVLANVCAAETLEQKKQPLIYRIHQPPSLDKLERLREFLNSLNIKLARPGNLRAMHFNGILAQAKGSEHEELLNQVVLRSQSQAEYSPANEGHFGLQLQRYAHFTSPIRRYADLIVHRALVGALGLGEGAITPNEEAQLEEIAAAISLTERRAMQAERETVDRLIASHLSTRIGDEFSGRINGVTRAGLFVTLSDTGADGFVPISTLGDEYFIFDESQHALIGEHSGERYQMGQEVQVRLVEAAPVAGALRFEMLSEGTKDGSLPRSRRSNRKAHSAHARRRNKPARKTPSRRR